MWLSCSHGSSPQCARFQAFSFLFLPVSCDDPLGPGLCFQVRGKGWLAEQLELGLILVHGHSVRSRGPPASG